MRGRGWCCFYEGQRWRGEVQLWWPTTQPSEPWERGSEHQLFPHSCSFLSNMFPPLHKTSLCGQTKCSQEKTKQKTAFLKWERCIVMQLTHQCTLLHTLNPKKPTQSDILGFYTQHHVWYSYLHKMKWYVIFQGIKAMNECIIEIIAFLSFCRHCFKLSLLLRIFWSA